MVSSRTVGSAFAETGGQRALDVARVAHRRERDGSKTSQSRLEAGSTTVVIMYRGIAMMW